MQVGQAENKMRDRKKRDASDLVGLLVFSALASFYQLHTKLYD